MLFTSELEDFHDYYSLLGDELGEYCESLALIYARPECIDAAFGNALDAEVRRIHKELKETYRIIDVPYEPAPITTTYKELEER